MTGLTDIEVELLKKLMGFNFDLETLSKMTGEEPEEVGKALNKLRKKDLVKLNDDNTFLLTGAGSNELKEIQEKQKVFERREMWGLHPAGGIEPSINLVYEPINEREMVYNWNGRKGLAPIQSMSDRNFFKIETTTFYLKDAPLKSKELIWEVPDRSVLENWAARKIKSVPMKELYDTSTYFTSIFFDTSEEAYHLLLFLASFQTWFAPYLPARFFVEVIGSFSGGKTCALNLLECMTRHGHLMNSGSLAFVGRGMERCKIAFLCDEFDKFAEENEELLALARSSQKKGNYARATQSGQIESFETRGSFYYTVHGEMDRAMSSRAMPIYTTRTDIKGMGKINLLKTQIGKDILTDWFLWYMDNAVDAIKNLRLGEMEWDLLVSKTKGINDKKERIEKMREQLLKHAEKSNADLEMGQEYYGRDEELGTLFSMFLKYVFQQSLSERKDEIENHVKALFEIRESRSEEFSETGLIGDVRNVLANFYQKWKNEDDYRTPDGYFMIPNIELKKKLADYLKSQGKFNPSATEMASVLRDLGFQRGESRKKMKSRTSEERETGENKRMRLCNIYTEKVCRILGIDVPKRLGEQRELGR
ncbi:MAG: hypothetical protein GF411_15295 [Candidatus Lokiarchaeota archaeon]|nr:hypothetical protein [Candidatus Lokiarchaeota archaeon]